MDRYMNQHVSYTEQCPWFRRTCTQIYGLKLDTSKTVCTLSYPLYFGTSNTRQQRGSITSQRSFQHVSIDIYVIAYKTSLPQRSVDISIYIYHMHTR